MGLLPPASLMFILFLLHSSVAAGLPVGSPDPGPGGLVRIAIQKQSNSVWFIGEQCDYLMYNRDVNAAKNMYHFALRIGLRIERVPHLTRNGKDNMNQPGPGLSHKYHYYTWSGSYDCRNFSFFI